MPDANVERENILIPGEIVTAIQIPELPDNSLSGYLKLKERGAWDFAVVSVAAAIQKNGGSLKSGTIVLGGVAPIPWLESEVSAQLAGLNASEESIAQISKQALSKAEPLAQNIYKVPLAQNMIKKLLLKLTV